MRSEKQIAASRANGARSRGPKTPAGKARSARNAIRHGLLSDTIVLDCESAPQFKQMVDGYAARFGPLDEVELGMVEEMVGSLWRLRRTWVLENQFFNTALAEQNDPSPGISLMNAFSGLADSNKLGLLHRYETRLHMMYQRAFRNLLTLRKLEPNNPPIPNVQPRPTRQPKNSPIPKEPKNPLPLNNPPAAEPNKTQSTVSLPAPDSRLLTPDSPLPPPPPRPHPCLTRQPKNPLPLNNPPATEPNKTQGTVSLPAPDSRLPTPDSPLPTPDLVLDSTPEAA